MAKNKKKKNSKKKKDNKEKDRKKNHLSKKEKKKEKQKKCKEEKLKDQVEKQALKETEILQKEGFFVMKSPLGMLKIIEGDGYIEGLYFVEEAEKEADTKLQNQVKKELEEYFSGKRKSFDLPLKTKGTEFQERVWKELLNIPYGETVSYGEMARRIGSPKAFRAIGGANGKNPIPILIPCHRVIASNGKISGYTGGVSKKEYLLKLEIGELAEK